MTTLTITGDRRAGRTAAAVDQVIRFLESQPAPGARVLWIGGERSSWECALDLFYDTCLQRSLPADRFRSGVSLLGGRVEFGAGRGLPGRMGGAGALEMVVLDPWDQSLAGWLSSLRDVRIVRVTNEPVDRTSIEDLEWVLGDELDGLPPQDVAAVARHLANQLLIGEGGPDRRPARPDYGRLPA